MGTTISIHKKKVPIVLHYSMGVSQERKTTLKLKAAVFAFDQRELPLISDQNMHFLMTGQPQLICFVLFMLLGFHPESYGEYSKLLVEKDEPKNRQCTYMTRTNDTPHASLKVFEPTSVVCLGLNS